MHKYMCFIYTIIIKGMDMGEDWAMSQAPVAGYFANVMGYVSFYDTTFVYIAPV